MATLSQNLKAKLEADTTLKELIGTRVYYNTLPQGLTQDYIFLQQIGASDDMTMDEAAGVPTRYQFTLEYYSQRLATMRTGVLRCQTILHKYRGALGDQTVQGIFAEPQADDYVPLGIGENSPYEFGALSLEVVL